MKTSARKVIALLLSCMLSVIVMMPVALADKPDSKYDPTLLSPIYNDGIAYLPIDTVSLLKEQGYRVVVTPELPLKHVLVTVRTADPTTTDKYSNERHSVSINWSDGVSVTNPDGSVVQERNIINETNPYGRIEEYVFHVEENGDRVGTYRLNEPLKNAPLNKNGRMYLSVDDINTMMQFLLDDPSYKVSTN